MTRSSAFYRRSTLFILSLLVILGLQQPRLSAAQDVELPEYIIQPGDTLSAVALQFDVTVADIQVANNIENAGLISVGQGVKIPGFDGVTGVLRDYTLRPGDTVENLALRLDLEIETLVILNRIVNPKMVYVGQPFLYVEKDAETITDISEIPVWRQNEVTFHLGENDTLANLAVEYDQPLFGLQTYNNWPFDLLSFYGQQVKMSAPPEADNSFPPPFDSIAVSPTEVTQGEPIVVRVTTANAQTLDGVLAENKLNFITTTDGEAHMALVGIYNFQKLGVYPFAITATDANGRVANFETRLRVFSGQRGQQSIQLPPEKSVLLDPEILSSEWQQLIEITDDFSFTRLWDAPFDYPMEFASERTTTTFGVARTYNGQSFDSFHGGLDFAGGLGTPITATADGVVVLAESLDVRGNSVIIDHGWGVYSGYWHLFELTSEVGQQVTQGQTIGTLGSTGLSTGNHLHWEIWVGGNQVDPLSWLDVDYSIVPSSAVEDVESNSEE